jgi:hypothetical protein
MPDKTAERLAHYKKLLKVRGVAPGPEGLIEYLRKRDDLTKGALRLYLEGCECDQKSLDKAAKFFELDAKQEADCDILMRVLAAVLFPTRKRGRVSAGHKYWTDYRLCLLGRKDRELRNKNPDLNDTEIAEIISKDKEFDIFRKDSNPIRKRLPAGRQSLEWLDGHLAKGRGSCPTK